MSDLIERAREASTLKYQYHTIHVPTILIRMADEADKAAAELSALQALHAAGSAPYDAEIDRLQKRNVELTAEVAALRADAALTSRAKALFTSFVYRTNGATGVVEQAIGAASLRFLHDLDAAHTLPAIDSARAKESGSVDPTKVAGA